MKDLSLNGKSVVVTGGYGFIPSHLVDGLILEKPSRLIVLDNFSQSGAHNLDEAKKNFGKLKIFKCDIAEQKELRAIIHKGSVDVIFHLATLSLNESLIRPKKVIETILSMAINLLELQRKGGFKTLIMMSSSEAYGSAKFAPMSEDHPLMPNTPYAAAKASADLLAFSYCKTFGNDVSIVRSFNNYGPRQNARLGGVVTSTIEALLLGRTPVLLGRGDQSRDFLFVGDTVRGILDIYKKPATREQVINLGSGKKTKIKDLIKMLIEISGKQTNHLIKAGRKSDVSEHLADISTARKLLNWSPQTNLRNGLLTTYNWYKENYYSH